MPFIGKQPQAGAYSKLDAITTSATATYNLTLDSGAYYPQSANHLLVSLNGVIQAPQDSFTVSGSQITFDSALTSADVIDFIIALGDTLDIGVPSAGSVNTSQLANDAVTSAKLDTNIDIDGNLLVGKTSVDYTTVGFEATPSSIFQANAMTADGKKALLLARKTSDGEIVQFRKDTTSVGSIGVSGGNNPYFSSGAANHGGLIFSDGGASTPPMHPLSSGSTLADGVMNIGSTSYRFKDLYLSSGVYLGGTGSANKLDDYEEGTWTPTLNFGGNSVGLTFGLTNGIYTKIGNIVSVQFRIELTNKGSSTGGALFGGLPFTATNLNGNYYPAFYGLHHDVNSNGSSGNPPANVLPIGQIAKNDTTWYYYAPDSTITINNTYFNNNSVLNGAVVYRTDS